MSFKPVLLAGAVALTLGAVALAQPQPSADLDQGWGAAERQDWYHLSQGSRLIPLVWLKTLEQPAGGGRRFLEDAYIAGFRYLPAQAGEVGDRLPVGFAADATPPAMLVISFWAFMPPAPIARLRMRTPEFRRSNASI